jgi:class 3 adenylate cyclase
MVRAFDGYVALLLGDGAIVYFGFPHGHEDNAARAIRAALALIAEVGKLTVLDQALRVRIGVATGMVVVGDITDGDSETEG